MENTIFYNADYIVIEYIDLIKSPYLLLLDQIRKNPKINEIMNIDEIDFLSDDGLYEWYRNRKHQNFFIDLNRYPDQISEESLNKLLEDQIGLSEYFYKKAVLLPLGGALKVMKRQGIAGEIIIYFPHHNDFAKADLEDKLNEKFNFMDNFDEILDMTKENSTYFLSNIDLINKLKEKNYLQFSSITLPIEYRYNKKNMDEFKIDLEALYKEHPFKLTYMRACTFAKPKE